MAEAVRDPEEFPKFDDLVPCCAAGCTISSCYLKTPDLIGCTNQNTVCCTRSKTICCKPGRTGDVLCTCNSTECVWTNCKWVCQTQSQALCTDTRCACPPDDREAPFMCNLLFWTFYYKDHFTSRFFAKGENLH